MILEKINQPNDIKSIPREDLPLLAEEITATFIETEFSGAQRHARRIRQIEGDIE